MRRRGRSADTARWLGAFALLAGALLAPLGPAVAQERPPTLPSTRQAPRIAFDLFSFGDLAMMGIRSSGDWGLCFTNMGVNGPFDQACSFTDANGARTRLGGVIFLYDEISFYVAAGPSDLPPQINRAALRGGGYTVNRSSGDPRTRKLMPSDRSGASLLNVGVTTTADGSCRDGSGLTAGYVDPNRQMLPLLSCPVSWPAGGFDGARLIPEESFVAYALGAGASDPFAFWRVPEDLREDRFLGDDQVYGEFADWTIDLRQQYGAVLPGGTGEPTLSGWPLGITVRFNGFYYRLPTLNNAYFWRATIANDSYRLYGDGVDPSTGVDYDSLYFGLNPIKIFPGNSVTGFGDQFAAFYLDPKRNAVLMNKCGVRGVENNAKDSPYYGSAVECASEFATGFDAGGLAVIFLRSPLGDTRNKWLSNPESPFYNPAHPEADDTLTINRMNACGFNTCHAGAHLRSERAYFGLLAGITEDWLDGRSRFDFTDVQYWNTVHPHDWPNRGDFNVWVPGDWDYNEDGIPDDVRAISCHGFGPNGCVEPWSDTLPGGFLNMGGVFPHFGVGPVSLASGDTTSFLIAFVWEADSAALEAQIDNVIDFYMNFYFGPREAPPPQLFATGEADRPGTVATSAGSVREASVTLMWEDMSGYRDPFIEDVLTRVAEAPPGTLLGNIRLLNPWLLDSLEARITNNLTAIHIFKSCDDGVTFTADATCFPSRVPADDQSSKWRNHGWLPYATVDPSVGRIRDLTVQPGIHLLYSLVTETRGAKFSVLSGTEVQEFPVGSGNYVCISPDCRVIEFEFAPAILSALKTSPGGSAVRVYVPLSRSAGYTPPTATFTLPTDRVIPPIVLTLADDVPDGEFVAFFADSVEVVEVHSARGREDLGYTTTARLFTIRDVYDPATQTVRRRVIRERQLTGPTQFAFQGAKIETDTDVVDGVTRTTRTGHFSGLTMIVARDGTAPILGTSQLVSGRTTPSELIGSRDYPGFVIDVFGEAAGSFRSHLALTPEGDTIPAAIANTDIVRWLENGATSLTGFLSRYEVEWLDHPFGPARTFRIDAGDPTQEVHASLASRADGATSVTGADALAALREAGVEVTELRPYSLPFRIRNVITGHEVQVAVLSHRESIRIGVGADTFRIFLPEDRWVPGDRLALIEPVPMDSTIAGGVVLDGAGNPIRTEGVRATWLVTLGCGGIGLEQCNPVPGIGNYMSLDPGSRTITTYNGHLSSDVSFAFEVRAAAMARADSGVDLSKVGVVPNPYVVYSRFERSMSDRVIKFTNLPPSGTIYIYTVSGQLVQRITYDETDLDPVSGDLAWNMVTRENTELAYGLYLFVLESEYGRASGKFVIIR